MTTLGDDFFERLRGLDNKTGRTQPLDEEVLLEFIETTESFTLAHDAPTVDTRADEPEKYIYTTTPGPTQIIWGEWEWKT